MSDIGLFKSVPLSPIASNVGNHRLGKEETVGRKYWHGRRGFTLKGEERFGIPDVSILQTIAGRNNIVLVESKDLPPDLVSDEVMARVSWVAYVPELQLVSGTGATQWVSGAKLSEVQADQAVKERLFSEIPLPTLGRLTLAEAIQRTVVISLTGANGELRSAPELQQTLRELAS